MEKLITLYHGSEQLVEEPTFGKGKKNNDFGLGFYCTKSEDLAKEWAVSSLRNGFANRYTLDTEYLNILNLNSPDYTILNWIAVLVEHRLFSIKTPVARRAKCYLIDHFSVNVNAYDLITGYRADDSYFDYAESFLNNGISVSSLQGLCAWENWGSKSSSNLSLHFRDSIMKALMWQRKRNTMSSAKQETMKRISFILTCWKRRTMACIFRTL